MIEVPPFPLPPSSLSWDILVFGGNCPRTNHPLPPLIFRFPASYTLRQVRNRADTIGSGEHRHYFAIRDSNGVVVKTGQTDYYKIKLRCAKAAKGKSNVASPTN